MASEFTTRRRVEFADTDCAGIVHFSVYFRYMEEAEHAFLRSCGLSVHATRGDGAVIGFPRVSTRCEYARAAAFEDELDIVIWVSRLGGKAIEYSCEMALDGELVARGRVVAIACLIRPHAPIAAVPIPDEYRAALEVSSRPRAVFRDEVAGGAS